MTGIDAMRPWTTQPLSPPEHGRRLGAFGSFGDSLSYWEWQDILLASAALALLVGLWALLVCRDQLHKVRLVSRCCRCRSRYPPPPERAAESAYELSATRDAEWEELDNGQGERYWHHRLTGRTSWNRPVTVVAGDEGAAGGDGLPPPPPPPTAPALGALPPPTEGILALLGRGANPDFQDDVGRAALHWTASKGFEDVADALLAAGANVDVQSTLGDTALMPAAAKGEVYIAQELIRMGANKFLRSKEGYNALEVAQAHGHSAIVAMLEA